MRQPRHRSWLLPKGQPRRHQRRKVSSSFTGLRKSLTGQGQDRASRPRCRHSTLASSSSRFNSYLPLLIALVCATSALPEVATGQVTLPEVTEVEFNGNSAFSDRELRLVIRTEPTSCPLVLAITTCAFGIDWGRDRSYFSTRTLAQDLTDLKVFHWVHGYRSAAVDTVVTRQGQTVSITFNIQEGDPLRIGSINFTGDTVAAIAEVRYDLPIAPGDPFSWPILEGTSNLLAAHLRNSGYASANVFQNHTILEGSDTATVTYRIEAGPITTFGPIQIAEPILTTGEPAGDRHLDERVILDRLPMREGDLYRAHLLQEALRNLYELDIVRRAQIDTSSWTEGDSVMPIVVVVEEDDLRLVRAGGGINSAECINVEGRWASRSFFGGGRILQVSGRLSNLLASQLHQTPLCSQAGTGEFGEANGTLAIDFNQPTLISGRANFFIGLFLERQSQKNIFVREALGLDAGLVFSLGGGSNLSTRYGPQLTRLDAAEVTFCAAFLACVPREINILAETHWLSPITVSFSQDRTIDPVDPRQGFRALVDLEYASKVTGSDFAYFRALADGSIYSELDERTVLALRLRAGRITSGGFVGDGALSQEMRSEVVPPQKRFYGGGATSIRGFAQGTLGPRSLSVSVQQLLRRRGPSGDPVCQPVEVVNLTCDGTPLVGTDSYQLRPVGGLAAFEASAELRFGRPGGILGGVAFVDVGQVWPNDFALSDVEISPGIGLRYYTLLGPIRVDVAYSFRGQQPLQVVTSQIRPFAEGDSDSDKIDIADSGDRTEPIDWVVSEELALLGSPVLFGDTPGFSLRRFQIHFSIGQAF